MAAQRETLNDRKILFVDNGAYNCKAMLFTPGNGATHSAQEGAPAPLFLTVPHCIGASPFAGRGLIGSETFRHMQHYHSLLLRRPCTSRGGFLTDAIAESYIWEHILEQFSIEEERAVDMWLTVPFGAPKGVARVLHALFTERFHFASVTFISASFLALLATAADKPDPISSGGCGLVVDAGFSSTTVVPYLDFLPVTTSIARIDVGGKLMTNRLKEYLSFTQVHLMEDEWLVNHIKETCCFVAHPLASIYAAYSREDVKGFMKKCRERKKPPLVTQHPLYREISPSLVQVYYLPSTPYLQPLGCTAEEWRRGVRRAGGKGQQVQLEGVLEAGHSPTSEGSSKEKQKSKAKVSRKRDREDISSGKREEKESDMIGGSKEMTGNAKKRSDEAESEQEQQLQMLPQLILQQECVDIPELLFTPGNMSIPQCGLSQAIGEGVFTRGLLSLLPLLHPLQANSSSLLHRVIVFGGTSNFLNFFERLETELQSYSAAEEKIRLARPTYFHCTGALPASCTAKNRKSTAVFPHFLNMNQARKNQEEGGKSIEVNEQFPLSAAELQPLKGAYSLFSDNRFATLKITVEEHATLKFRGPASAVASPTSTSNLNSRSISVEDVLEKLEKLW